MDLFPVSMRTRGRPSKQVEASIERDITPADLKLLDAPRPQISAVKTLRDSHHAVARLVAAGFRLVQISADTGYSLSRISVLLKDPAFIELVEFYRLQEGEYTDKLRSRLGALAGDVVAELTARIDAGAEDITADELVKIGKFAADRAGHGPVATSNNLNVNVGLAARLKTARERAREE